RSYTVYFAKPFLMPFVFALLFALVLRPIQHRFTRLGLPDIPSAIVVMVIVVGLTLVTLYALSGPILTWASMLPNELRQIESKVHAFREPMQKVTEVAEQVDEITSMQKTPAGPPVVEVRQERVSDWLFRMAGAFAGYLAVTLVLVFFMLAFGDTFYRQLGRHDQTVAVLHEISDSVSQYLFTITVINIGLGVC